MVIVLFWILCGVISAMIGSKKGEALGSFFIGVIFGPFGIIFALLSNGNREKCPFCKTLIDKTATICPNCRSTVGQQTTDKKDEENIGILICVLLGLVALLIIILAI